MKLTSQHTLQRILANMGGGGFMVAKKTPMLIDGQEQDDNDVGQIEPIDNDVIYDRHDKLEVEVFYS